MQSLDFVVRIQHQKSSILGTGILVAPDWVLTCRHVICEIDDYGKELRFYPEDQLRVKFDDVTLIGIVETKLHPQKDLALLHLGYALDIDPAHFLKDLRLEREEHSVLIPCCFSCSLRHLDE